MSSARRIALALLILAAAGPALAEPVELKLGHIDPKGSIYHLTTEEFAKRVNAKLNGKAVVKLYRSGELGTESEMLDQVRKGETAMALLGQIMPSVAQDFGVFELPYILLTRSHLKKVRKTLLETYLEPAAAAQGLRVLGMWETGFRYVTNNKKPIREPGDLKGLRIRVDPGSNENAIFEALNAAPKPVNLDAAYMLLKRNELDGQTAPLIVVKNRRLNEVQKYLSLTRHSYTPAYLVVSEQYFSRLDPDVQAALSSTAAELQDWVLDEGEKLDKTIVDELSKTIAVNDVDLLSFVLASMPIYKSFSTTTPSAKGLVKLLFDSSSLLSVEQKQTQ